MKKFLIVLLALSGFAVAQTEEASSEEAAAGQPELEAAAEERPAFITETAPAPEQVAESRPAARVETQSSGYEFPEVRFSAGVGGNFIGNFGGGVSADGDEFNLPSAGGGGYIFVDATFAEVYFGFGGSAGTWGSVDIDFGRSYVDIGVNIKYPFDIGVEFLTLSPVLGMSYEASTGYSLDFPADANAGIPDGETYKSSSSTNGDVSALWFKFGASADYDITEEIYLRGQLLYGFRTAYDIEKNVSDEVKSYVNKTTGESLSGKTVLGHGLTIRIAAGYRF